MLYSKYKRTQRDKRIAAAPPGATKYIGAACPRAHSPVRYISTGQCVECVAEQTAASRERARQSLNPQPTPAQTEKTP